MSSVYVLEPPTKGKVILNTTYGPIDIELWPKEAPKAVRNFVQLCLEGYYDDTIFHRVIPGFLVQGGDPTSTGNGGESIYGGAFADEFHSRLRFNHRGLLACANAGTPHSNGSQFFFSLDRCEWLDRKNTIFGKVTGDSVYNLVTLGEVETGKEDRPIDPAPRITSVEVLWNPFEDIVPRVVARVPDHPAADLINTESKKKPVKKLNLLSFGEEAEEEEKELAAVKQKIKSSHDVLSDPRLLKEEMPSKELNPAETKAIRDMQLSVREALSSKKEVSQKDAQTEDDGGDGDDDGSFDTRMRQQVLRKRMEAGDLPNKQKPKKNGSSSLKAQQVSTSRSESVTKSIDDDQPKVEKLSLKKKGIGSDVRADRMAKADTDMQLMGDAERRRLLQKQKKRRLQGREDDVLERIEKFKKAFSTDATGSGAAGEDLSDWKKTRLQFAPDAGKDGMTRKEDPNDYVVHDPLLEKGKEKFNLMQAKQKKKGREWAGKSLT